MKHRFILVCLLAGFSLLQMAAQSYVVTGSVTDADNKEPIELATIQLLRPDSTMATGDNSNANGHFKVSTHTPGRYIVKISFVSYLPQFVNISLSSERDSVSIGNVALRSNDVALRQALVSTTAVRVEQKEDTTIFNASAYRTPEGSTLEALVKQLPGVEVSDDGKIKWNGKEVQEFLVNGKDFFKGDTKIAMKNLPVDMVNKLKAYDKKSDYSELTGIDDGEETTVLDISTKRALDESWILNADGGYGTHDRYSARFFGSRFTDKARISAFGSLNNTGDQGFGSPRGGGGGGLTTSKNAGVDFSWENGKKKKEGNKFEVGGNVRWSHVDTDLLSTTASETFLTQNSASSFSNSSSHSTNAATSVNGGFRLKWHPDSLTRINFRPNFSYSKNERYSDSRTATFNEDPYSIKGMVDPLDSVFSAQAAATSYARATMNPELLAILVNSNKRESLSEGTNANVGASLMVMRRLNNLGRNISFDANANYSKSENESFSISNINYYPLGGRPSSFLNQYTTTPSKNWNYRVGVSYSEPLTKDWHLQFRYNFSYKYSDSDRSLYDLDKLSGQWAGPTNYFPIGTLPDPTQLTQAILDAENSQYATYRYLTHRANIGIRYNTKTIKFNAGLNFDPEKTKMEYERPGQPIDTLITRKVFNVSPQVRFRYNISKTNRLEIFYRGASSQPSMTNLLDVVDDSDPLSITMGNPGLKPSWNNSARFSYNGYNAEREQGIVASANYSQTMNSISNLMVYDESTGVRYTRPANIDGNWNVNGNFMFNTGLGEKKLFTISTFTNLSYNNSVGYVSSYKSGAASSPVVRAASVGLYDHIFAAARPQKNTNRTVGVGEMLNAAYRASWFDVGLNGNLNYQHSRSELQKNANMDTWNFSYGANANFNFSWGMSISTDINMSSRRGYADRTMNTNELIWNAQITQSFLKNKAATLSLKFYDILNQQSNVSRVINAQMRSDSWNNAINSYCMLHFTYRLNIFGGKKGGEAKKKKDSDKKFPGNFTPPPGGMSMPHGSMPMMPMGGGGWR